MILDPKRQREGLKNLVECRVLKDSCCEFKKAKLFFSDGAKELAVKAIRDKMSAVVTNSMVLSLMYMR